MKVFLVLGALLLATLNYVSCQSDSVLENLAEDLLSLDVNNVASAVTISYQGQTSSGSSTDRAPEPLLEVRASALEGPTISRLRALYNNFNADTSINESTTSAESDEVNDFLDAILSTSVMQRAQTFLEDEGLLSTNFRSYLETIWFEPYSRSSGVAGSSGIEHIFLGEIDEGSVSGFHSWIFFNNEENDGSVNYLGYLTNVDLGSKGAVIQHHFTWDGHNKPISSMFIGTSPELELALYSVCFLARPNQLCPVSLNGKKFDIQTYDISYNGKKMVGSAYPAI